MKMEMCRLFENTVRMLLPFLLLLTLVGCKTKYIAVPEYHNVYTHHTDTILRSDTLFVRDSVVIRTQGDSTIVEKTRWRDRYVNTYKTRRDTLVRRDSVFVVQKVAKERSGSRLWRLWDEMGNFAALVMAVFVVAMLVMVMWKVWKRVLR